MNEGMTAGELITLLSTLEPSAAVQVYDSSWGSCNPLTEWVVVRTASGTTIRLGTDFPT